MSGEDQAKMIDLLDYALWHLLFASRDEAMNALIKEIQTLARETGHDEALTVVFAVRLRRSICEQYGLDPDVQEYSTRLTVQMFSAHDGYASAAAFRRLVTDGATLDHLQRLFPEYDVQSFLDATFARGIFRTFTTEQKRIYAVIMYRAHGTHTQK